MTNEIKVTPAAIAALKAGDADNFVAAVTPGGIEAQEAQGQRDLVASQAFPKELFGVTRGNLECLGFVFGDDIDDIFVECKLPEGWKIQATDHPMHSDIVDERGRKRISVFYKAAFYDRRASANIKARFSCGVDYQKSKDGLYQVVAFDNDEPIKSFGVAEDYKDIAALEEAATDWLTRKYPDWDNPSLYWENEWPAGRKPL